ncbi:MAG: site-specific DNA-methyltransferase [Verrucomicrobia bacterium]|nr:site-specific DNA-methyltransferase [Verrucomicrobiota bacterium]MDE3098631.1 site-specific DNA-methyltransferase [Verrucomicrobiota bacterium]
MVGNLFNERIHVAETFSDDERLVLILDDALECAKKLPANFFSLIITSPPYNLGKEYERRSSLRNYLALQKPLIHELKRALKHNGSICWQVGNYVEDGEVFPLDVFYYDLFKNEGLKLRNRIIWHFEHGLHCSLRFSGRYETLLWFTKSDNYAFHLDPVRVPAKYPGKLHFKGGKRGQPSGNPLGKNPSDVWQIVAQDWEREVWEIPNVKANHPEKSDHPCQFPVELVERCVLAFTGRNDWVYDPYCGVGSALIAAAKHGRRAAGCDRDQTYLAVARERLQKLADGTLKMRPLGKPVHVPTGREKVAQRPAAWDTENVLL